MRQVYVIEGESEDEGSLVCTKSSFAMGSMRTIFELEQFILKGGKRLILIYWQAGPTASTLGAPPNVAMTSSKAFRKQENSSS